MNWFQRALRLPPLSRGFHLVTRQVVAALPEMSQLQMGLLHVFIQHTSASLAINENADPDVPRDLERVFNTLAPEDFPYEHTAEGPDDMPAHVKAAMLGSAREHPMCKVACVWAPGKEFIFASIATGQPRGISC